MKVRTTLTHNLIDYSNWISGTTGDTGIYINYDPTYTGINDRINEIGPFGSTITLWRTSGETSTGNYGGWITNKTTIIDNTKQYRFSVWVKRKAKVFTGLGSRNLFYFGLMTYNSGGTSTGTFQKTTGGGGTNNYFIYGTYATLDPILTVDEWFLCSAMVYPVNTLTGGTNSIETGVFGKDGTNYGIMSGEGDQIWTSTSYYTDHRVYHYAFVMGEMYYFAYPRIDEIDGSEPSIAQLLSGEANDLGSWKNASMKINIGDSWKSVSSIKINVNDSWKNAT